MVLIQTINQWITLAEAHELLGTTSPGEDVEVQSMIDSIDAMILAYLHRDLRHAQYVQIFYRPTGSFLSLDNWPLLSVDSADSDGVSIADPDSEFEIDYQLSTMYFTDQGLTFNGSQPKKVTVTYTSGYTELPAELTTMFNTLLVERYAAGGSSESASTGAIKKVSLTGVAAVEFDTGGSVSYSGVDRSSGVPEELKPYVGLLDKYRSDRAMGVV